MANRHGRSALAAALLIGAVLWTGAARADTLADICARTAKLGNTAACEAAVETDPANLVNLKNLAFAYLAVYDAKNSFRVHREVVARAPDDPDSHFVFAIALATFHEYREAIEPVRTAIRLSPDDAMVLRLALIVFEHAGEEREAFAVAQRAAERGDTLLMFDLAQYYAKGRGTTVDSEAALRWLERAAEAGHVTAMRQVSDIYRTGGNGAAADPARAAHWAERAKRHAFGN
ncbi:MAG: SEL1-like repeat protein [Rhodospirillales bacterium]|nr:SEL1-like repeat protein [Rhodospirillales bacterium]